MSIFERDRTTVWEGMVLGTGSLVLLGVEGGCRPCKIVGVLHDVSVAVALFAILVAVAVMLFGVWRRR